MPLPPASAMCEGHAKYPDPLTRRPEQPDLTTQGGVTVISAEGALSFLRGDRSTAVTVYT